MVVAGVLLKLWSADKHQQSLFVPEIPRIPGRLRPEMACWLLV